MGYRILVDSCSDLTAQLKEDPSFKVVPLSLMIDDKIFVDNDKFNQREFLRAMKESPNSPKSACPSPEDYMREFSQDDDTFIVTLSSQLSGSYNSTELAKRLYLEDNPDKKIEVIDSCSASVGQTLISMKIKELVSQGHMFDDIVQAIKTFRSEMRTKFVLENLDNLRKNGRLSHLKALVASVLNIKPIMAGTPEGTITKLDQARGITKALLALAKMVENDVIKPSEKILGIAHCNCVERAQFIRDEIMSRVPFKDSFIVDTAGVSTLYANEGGIIVAY